MAELYGSHFIFGEKNSAMYGLILANVDTTRMGKLRGEVEGVTIFNKKANKRYLITDDTASSPISFDCDIVTESGRRLDPCEQRAIEKWLFGRRGYQKLYINSVCIYSYANPNSKKCYMNCRFINPEKIEGNGGIVGYKVTLESDSDMLWQDPVVLSFDLSESTSDETKTIVAVTDTDLDEYIYPKVTLHIGDMGGGLSICNESDNANRITKFTDLQPNTTITMDGETNHVSNGMYSKLARRNFIRLLDGENTISIDGDVSSIDIEYSARRFF